MKEKLINHPWIETILTILLVTLIVFCLIIGQREDEELVNDPKYNLSMGNYV